MTVKSIAAILAILTVPVCAQAQQKDVPKPTKAAAERVVAIITGDKAKAKIYCDIAKPASRSKPPCRKRTRRKPTSFPSKPTRWRTNWVPNMSP